MRSFWTVIPLVIFGLQTPGFYTEFISTAHAQCTAGFGVFVKNSDKPLSTAWYCHNKKRKAKLSAKNKWRDGAEERWGGRYASWNEAIKKRVQCRRTHKALNGDESCGYGSYGKWQCRAMACAMEVR